MDCISPDLKLLVLKNAEERLATFNKANPLILGTPKVQALVKDLEKFVEEVKNMEDCKSLKKKQKDDKKDKPKKARTPRQEYMSSCMRKPENGGRGLPMAECAAEWKEKK